MRTRRGFTLIEVLVALMILTVVIMTSMAAFLERNRRLKQASETILAYQALANESEYRRRRPFDTLESDDKEFLSDTSLLAPLVPFHTIVTTSQTQPGVKNVLMVVRWNEGKREARLEVVRADTGGSPLW